MSDKAAQETIAAADRVIALSHARQFARCADVAWRAAGRCERLGTIGWARAWRAFANECDGPGYAANGKWLSGAVRLKAAAEAALGGLRAVPWARERRGRRRVREQRRRLAGAGARGRGAGAMSEQDAATLTGWAHPHGAMGHFVDRRIKVHKFVGGFSLCGKWRIFVGGEHGATRATAPAHPFACQRCIALAVRQCDS